MTPEVTADTAELPKSAPSTAGMTTKVVKGSLWTLAGQVAPLIVSLVTTPFVIRMLGAESYGVLILVGLIPTYLGFADFGMGMASTKFASEAYAEGDHDREARIVRTAALIATSSSLPVALILFLMSPQIIGFFNVPEHLQGEASVALKLAAITFVVNLLNSIFNTPQLTRLRMDLNAAITAGFRVLSLCLIPLAVYFGGIVGAVSVLLITSLLTLALHILVSSSLSMHLFSFSFDAAIARKMMGFGTAIAVAGMAALLLANLEKGILARLLPVKALAYYGAASTLAGMLTLFASSMSQSLMPAFSQLQTAQDGAKLNDLYARGIKMNLLWSLPTLICLCLLAKPFFTVWGGEDFGTKSTVPFFVLSLGLLFNVVSYLPYTSIAAAGRTGLLAGLYWAEIIPYVLAVIFLTSAFGIVGTASAWALRMAIDTILLFVIAKRCTGVTYSFSNLAAFAPLSLLGLMALGLNYYIGDDLLLVFVGTVCLFFIYLLVSYRFVLDAEEANWLLQRIARSR